MASTGKYTKRLECNFILTTGGLSTTKATTTTQVMTVEQVKSFSRCYSETATMTEHVLPNKIKEYMRQTGDMLHQRNA